MLQKKPLINLKALFLFLVFVLALPVAGEAETPPPSPQTKCKGNFPNLFSDICWKCMFPIRIGGKKVMNVGDMPDNIDTGNIDDFNPDEFICTCKDGNDVNRYGIYISLWEPARVLEVVQRPNCFPFLFGMDIEEISDGAYGSKGNQEQDRDKAFYHVHYYTLPLLSILDLITGMDFCTDWLTDIDLMYFTEIDPLWNDDELTLYLNPEAIIFANPIAQALCAVDCVTATAGFPINQLFWCAGCWGSMYPYTGNAIAVGSPVRTTSLLASRMIARLARLPVPPAIEYDTSSAGAKCGGQIRPLIKKSQYKFSTIFPIPETEGKCCHSLGSSTFLWGEWRNIPVVGEFQTYLMWRKRNCCLKIL